MFETDATRLAMLRALGGGPCYVGGRQFTGLLELPYVGVGDVPVESAALVLHARSSDLTALGVVHGTTISIGVDSYVVRGTRPDGVGMTELQLESQ